MKLLKLFTSTISGWVVILSITCTSIFLALKLFSVISWSWFWVLFPLILGVGILVLLIVLWFILALWLAYLRTH